MDQAVGTFTMRTLKRKKNSRRWVNEHTLTLLPVLITVGLAVGLALGWFLRMFWHG